MSQVKVLSRLVWQIPIGWGFEEEDIEKYSSVLDVQMGSEYYTVTFVNDLELDQLAEELSEYGLFVTASTH